MIILPGKGQQDAVNEMEAHEKRLRVVREAAGAVKTAVNQPQLSNFVTRAVQQEGNTDENTDKQ
ncbi:MAG: hypothetical protein D6706_11265 [Chloroflexi bacterium]|nr:MAG: hypothetical protein D6706_11265 [Chloroflexota bacterium]